MDIIKFGIYVGVGFFLVMLFKNEVVKLLKKKQKVRDVFVENREQYEATADLHRKRFK